MALNKAAAGSAYRCFKERLVTKAYLALVSPPCHLLPWPPGVPEHLCPEGKLRELSWRRERLIVGD